MLRDYFVALFTSECNGDSEVLGKISRCVTLEMNMALDSSITENEIMDALGQMDSRKAPDIDDLFGLFYNEN